MGCKDYTHIHAHIHTRTHTPTHIHTQAHIHTHTHTHTNPRTLSKYYVIFSAKTFSQTVKILSFLKKIQKTLAACLFILFLLANMTFFKEKTNKQQKITNKKQTNKHTYKFIN